MSTVTTTPEMDTPAATLPDARLRAEGSSDRLGKSAGLDGDPPAERRRSRCPSDSPIDFLEGLSAVVVLERIPVPLVAIAWDGVIVFANPAFAEMVGYRPDGLAGSAFSEIFRTVPAAVCAFSGADVLANLVVELQHREGWKVRAKLTKSALMRSDDPVVLMTFDDLTDQLWSD